MKSVGEWIFEANFHTSPPKLLLKINPYAVIISSQTKKARRIRQNAEGRFIHSASLTAEDESVLHSLVPVKYLRIFFAVSNMSEKKSFHQSSIDVRDQSTVRVQGDMVGGDKNIYNIILISQFLEQIKIEDFFPQLDPSKIADQVDQMQRNHTLDTNDTHALEFAGHILGDLFKEGTLKAEHFNFRDLLRLVPSSVISRLKESKYWESCFQRSEVFFGYNMVSGEYDIVWLNSTPQMWQKIGHEPRHFGIAQEAYPSSRHFMIVEKHKKTSIPVDFEKFSREDFRLFMIALLIDIMHIPTEASRDLAILNSLSHLISPRTIRQLK